VFRTYQNALGAVADRDIYEVAAAPFHPYYPDFALEPSVGHALVDGGVYRDADLVVYPVAMEDSAQPDLP